MLSIVVIVKLPFGYDAASSKKIDLQMNFATGVYRLEIQSVMSLFWT
jgi:hypothetical protein